MDGPGECSLLKDISKSRDWEVRDWAKGGRWVSDETRRRAIEEMTRRGIGLQEGARQGKGGQDG